MSYTVSLQQRLLQLQKAHTQLPETLKSVARNATIRAIEATQDATPPKADTGRGPYIGTNTITGAAKSHWATDSQSEPEHIADAFVTYLRNYLEYISYLNDGHRMDRHFVPGLYINQGSGLLEYDPGRKVGIVVGTKTKYVKGEFMVDKGKKAYEDTVLAELDKEIRRLMG